ncbi:MAG: hypothetical protein ACYTG0_32190 [Planctomycetota bacterium]|jgi:hypothetical protein
MKRVDLSYHAAMDDIRSGDLLLMRPQWWAIHSKLICVAGRTEYCHAAMVDFGCFHAGEDCYHLCLEMVATGGRITALASQVEWYPGLIDVYRPNPDSRWPEFDRTQAVEAMGEFVTRSYGYWNLLRVALRHLALTRLFFRAETDDVLKNGRPPFCSQAVAAACHKAGVDVVPHLSDRMTEPADLARSLFFQYQFTLVP